MMVVDHDHHTVASMMVVDHDHHTSLTNHPYLALNLNTPARLADSCLIANGDGIGQSGGLFLRF